MPFYENEHILSDVLASRGFPSVVNAFILMTLPPVGGSVFLSLREGLELFEGVGMNRRARR